MLSLTPISRLVSICSYFSERGIGLVTRLAWQCISTYRGTDYLGGCNGARIRFSPGKDWEVNKNLDRALDLLSPVKARYGASLSWADLIILAGNTALELTNSDLSLPFCPGRTDDTRGSGWEDLQPRKDSLNFSLQVELSGLDSWNLPL